MAKTALDVARVVKRRRKMDRGLRLILHTRIAITGCLEWIGYRNGQGYGQFNTGGVVSPAHRVSYQLFVGEIPEGHFVLHKCDNTSCCAPHHLFTGTQRDNMQDCISKGRFAALPRRYGLEHPKFKMTDAQLSEIVKSKASVVELSKRFGVHRHTISRNRKRFAESI